MALEGDLAVIGLADIFQTLAASQKAGTLVVENPESRKSIYFQEGMVWVISEGVRRTLKVGEAMIASGKITPAQLATALEQQQITKERLGEILQSMGLVTEQDVEIVIRSQLEEDVFDVFTWKAGKFKFLEDTIPEGFDETEDIMNLNVQSIVMEAARRSDELEVIREFIPSDDYVLRAVSDKSHEHHDDSFHELVLGMLDGQQSVNDLCEQLGGHRFELKTALAELMQEQLVEPIPTESMVELGIGAMEQGDSERAAKLLEVAVSQDPSDVGNFLLLAEAYESVGDKKRAGRTYKQGATAAAEAGEVEHAVDFLTRARRLLPNDLEVNEQVLELLSAFPDHIPDAETRFVEEGKALVKAYRREKRYPDATRLCHRLLQEDPEDVDVHKALVNVHLDQGNDEEALAEYDVLAQLLTKKKDFVELTSVLEKIAKLDPSRANEVNKRLDQIATTSAERKRRAIKRLLKLGVAAMFIGALVGGYLGYKSINEEWDSFEAALRSDDMAQERWEKAHGAIDEWVAARGFWTALIRKRITGLHTTINELDKKHAEDTSDAEKAISDICMPLQALAGEFEKAPSLEFGASKEKKEEAIACFEQHMEGLRNLEADHKTRLEVLKTQVQQLGTVLAELQQARDAFQQSVTEAGAAATAQGGDFTDARDSLKRAVQDKAVAATRGLPEIVPDCPPEWRPYQLSDLGDFRSIDFPLLVATTGEPRKFRYRETSFALDAPDNEWQEAMTPHVLNVQEGKDLEVQFRVAETIRMVPADADVIHEGAHYGRQSLLFPGDENAPRYLLTNYVVRLASGESAPGVLVQALGLDLGPQGSEANVSPATICSTPEPFLLFEEFRFGIRVDDLKGDCSASPTRLGSTLLFPAGRWIYQVDATGQILNTCDIEKGKAMARKLTLPQIRVPILVPQAGGSIYAVTQAGFVIELDRNDISNIKAVHEPKPQGRYVVKTRAQLAGSTIVFNTQTPTVLAFDTAGKRWSQWSVRRGSRGRETSGNCLVEGGKLYVPTDHNLYSIPFAGSLDSTAKPSKFTKHTGELLGALIPGKGCMYAVDDELPTLFAFGFDGSIARTRFGRRDSSYRRPARFPSPAVSDDLIVTGTVDGKIQCFLPWQPGQTELTPGPWGPLDLKSPAIQADPFMDRGRLFVGTPSGDFLAVDASNGRILWRFRPFEGDEETELAKFEFAPAALDEHIGVGTGSRIYILRR